MDGDKKESLTGKDYEKDFSRESFSINANNQMKENFNMDKEKVKKQLEAAKNVEERIKLFAKRSDSFGLEAIVSMIPVVGDLTPSIVSTCYLLVEGIHVGLSRKDCLKILGYQTADALIGVVPVIGDVADFFFKGNKYSSKIFSKHLEKLKKSALEQGISQSEIDNMGKSEKRFMKTMDRYMDYKVKKSKK